VAQKEDEGTVESKTKGGKKQVGRQTESLLGNNVGTPESSRVVEKSKKGCLSGGSEPQKKNTKIKRKDEVKKEYQGLCGFPEKLG